MTAPPLVLCPAELRVQAEQGGGPLVSGWQTGFKRLGGVGCAGRFPSSRTTRKPSSPLTRLPLRSLILMWLSPHRGAEEEEEETLGPVRAAASRCLQLEGR